jgi:acyl carrier protein
MSRVTFDLLRNLARHIGRPVSSLRPSQHLERDLSLTPLQIVLVALEAETEEGLELDLEGLENVATVGDLSTFLARCASHDRADGLVKGSHERAAA